MYATTDKATYDFSSYTHLMLFAKDLYNKNLSLEEAKNKQDELLDKIEELEERINPLTNKPDIKDIEKMKDVIKDARKLYDIRNDINNTIKGTKKRRKFRLGKVSRTFKRVKKNC